MTPEEARQIAETLLDKISSRSALDCPLDDGGLIAAALLAAATPQWRPVETASKTDWILGLPIDWQDYEPWHASTKLLIVRWREATETDEAAVGFSEEGWRDMDGFRYTLINWMPLPEPPAAVDKTEEAP